MILIKGPQLPTPFGAIQMPNLETPPIKLPTPPDERQRKAIMHGVGEDLSQVFGFVPWIGGLIEDFLEDTHHAEVKKLLTPEEYSRFAEYNKSLPTVLALARTLLFKEVK